MPYSNRVPAGAPSVKTYHDASLIVFEQILAFRSGVALEKLFRIPLVEAGIVFLLKLSAFRSNARRHSRQLFKGKYTFGPAL